MYPDTGISLKRGNVAKFDFSSDDVHYNDYIKNIMSSPEELWDVLDGDRNVTGKTHKRKDPLGPGEYHQVVTGFVRNSKGEYLIMKRAPEKGFAGYWEVPGGSVTAGESSYTGIVREVLEETGIDVSKDPYKLVTSYKGDHYFSDAWLFEKEFDLKDVKYQKGETCDSSKAFAKDIIEMEASERFTPFPYLREVFEKIGEAL